MYHLFLSVTGRPTYFLSLIHILHLGQRRIEVNELTGRDALGCAAAVAGFAQERFLLVTAGEIVAVHKDATGDERIIDLFEEGELFRCGEMMQGFEGDHGIKRAGERLVKIAAADHAQVFVRVLFLQLAQHGSGKIHARDGDIRAELKDLIQLQTGAAAEIKNAPVSYTHLDVYKRQGKHDPYRAGFAQSGDDGHHRIGDGIVQVILYEFHDGCVKRVDAGQLHGKRPLS